MACQCRHTVNKRKILLVHSTLIDNIEINQINVFENTKIKVVCNWWSGEWCLTAEKVIDRARCLGNIEQVEFGVWMSSVWGWWRVSAVWFWTGEWCNIHTGYWLCSAQLMHTYIITIALSCTHKTYNTQYYTLNHKHTAQLMLPVCCSVMCTSAALSYKYHCLLFLHTNTSKRNYY